MHDSTITRESTDVTCVHGTHAIYGAVGGGRCCGALCVKQWRGGGGTHGLMIGRGEDVGARVCARGCALGYLDDASRVAEYTMGE